MNSAQDAYVALFGCLRRVHISRLVMLCNLPR
ncbi:Uncharacterised protein [Mycobacterium tuberculosis]|nr:Uncharacterised protein [Mycobacterium tuberculosis]